jgi:hypothetical protein
MIAQHRELALASEEANGDISHDEVALSNIVAQGLSDNRYVKSMQYINPRVRSWISCALPAESYRGDRLARVGHPFQSRYDSQLVVPIGGARSGQRQRRYFDLKSVLQEVVATLSPACKKTPYALVLDLAPGIAMNSFPGPLGQIVINFINNAVMHGFEGRTAGAMQLATCRIDGELVELMLSDDGVGIPEANLGRVFDPFFMTKLGHGGSGLGSSGNCCRH